MERIEIRTDSGVAFRRLLLVEDDDDLRDAMAHVLRKAGYFVLTVDSVPEALDLIAYVPVDLVLSDVVLPHGSGVDVLAHARKKCPWMPVILMSAFAAEDFGSTPAIRADGFLRKPILPSRVLAMVEHLTQNARHQPVQPLLIAESAPADVGSATETVHGLLRLISIRDAHTLQHSLRVSGLGVRLAQFMGLPEGQVSDMAVVGWVHDVGKISVPTGLLQKRGPLTPEERVLMSRHPVTGAAILSSLKLSPAIVNAVRHHHERYDGQCGAQFSGYPQGLAGEQIPLLARVLAVVDAFDAMTNDRLYRRALLLRKALMEIETHAGTHFDPAIARVFLEMIQHELTHSP